MQKLILLFLYVLFFVGCKKNQVITPSSNIYLKDKPVDVIFTNIQGKWKLEYVKGGLVANKILFPDKITLYFFKDNRVLNTYGGIRVADTTINWIQGIDAKGKDSINIITFNDNFGGIYDLVIDRIYNDTLIFYENGFDGLTYYSIRIN